MAQTRLFVGNLPYAANEQDLRAFFEAGAGKVATVRIITDLDTGRSKGYGFVEMATPEGAQKAIESLNDASFSGRKLIVNEARPRNGGQAGARKQRP